MLRDIIHIDVVECIEYVDKFEVLVDFYYNHVLVTFEDYETLEDGTVVVPVQRQGYEAIGWRFREHIPRSKAKDDKELVEVLKQMYTAFAIEKAYQVPEEIVINDTKIQFRDYVISNPPD